MVLYNVHDCKISIFLSNCVSEICWKPIPSSHLRWSIFWEMEHFLVNGIKQLMAAQTLFYVIDMPRLYLRGAQRCLMHATNDWVWKLPIPEIFKVRQIKLNLTAIKWASILPIFNWLFETCPKNHLTHNQLL